MGSLVKYKSTFAEQGFLACFNLGATNIDLAKLFDVAPKTINEWFHTYPEFKKEIQRGKDLFDSNLVEKSLLTKAQGFFYTETTEETYYESGKKLDKTKRKKIEKYIPPSDTAIVFWLKNRQKERWRDVQHVEATNNNNLQIDFTVNSSPDKIGEILNVLEISGAVPENTMKLAQNA